MKRGIYKKTLALMLAGAMALGLAACGSQGAEKEAVPDAGAKGAENAGDESGAETLSNDADAEAAQADGGYVPGTLPLTTQEVTLTIGLSGDPRTADHETNEYTLWLEEQTGIHLDFVVFSSDKTEYKNQLTLMMTTDEKLPDIILDAPFDAAGVKNYGMDGYFADISGYLQEKGTWYDQQRGIIPEEVMDRIAAIGTAANGAIYSYPCYQQQIFDKIVAPCFINQAWLDKVGAQMPTTPDELYEVLVKFRDEDPNGNGKADEIPITGSRAYRSAMPEFLINAFVYCNDNFLWNVTDGKLWSPYSSEEYREAMIYMNKLVSEKLLSTTVFTGDDSILMPMITPEDGVGIVGAVSCHPTLHMDENSELLKEYTGLAPLKAPEGNTTGGYAPYFLDNYRYNNVITEDCADPALAFYLLDFMSSPESVRRNRYGVYGEDWTDAAEGAVGNTGLPARVEVLDSAAYSGNNNRCWHYMYCVFVTGRETQTSYVDDGSGLSIRNGLLKSELECYTNTPVPEEVFNQVVYTEEEQAVVSELKTLYQEYVQEARGLFATGALDPGNDADWNSYLDELEARGQSKLLECAQAAYSRL